MASHNDFGKEAEKVAVDFLLKEGYLVKTTNFRFQKAEIDIIAEDIDCLVIVEVKARSTTHFLQPEEAVDNAKMKLLVKATNAYIEKYNVDKEVRFDIISITKNSTNQLQIHHIKDAFQALDCN